MLELFNLIIDHFEDIGMIISFLCLSVFSMNHFVNILKIHHELNSTEHLKLKHLGKHLSILISTSLISFIVFIVSIFHLVISSRIVNFVTESQFRIVSTILEMCLISLGIILIFVVQHLRDEDNGEFTRMINNP